MNNDDDDFGLTTSQKASKLPWMLILLLVLAIQTVYLMKLNHNWIVSFTFLFVFFYFQRFYIFEQTQKNEKIWDVFCCFFFISLLISELFFSFSSREISHRYRLFSFRLHTVLPLRMKNIYFKGNSIIHLHLVQCWRWWKCIEFTQFSIFTILQSSLFLRKFNYKKSLCVVFHGEKGRKKSHCRWNWAEKGTKMSRRETRTKTFSFLPIQSRYVEKK